MQPVLPSTMVRGPAAFTIIFITSADSQPWQVRCPEVKNSCVGIFLTPLNGSRLLRWINLYDCRHNSSPFRLILWRNAPSPVGYSRNPIHCVNGCGLPSAAL